MSDNDTQTRTDALKAGDVVLVGNGLRRTVDHITDSGYLNARNLTIWNVMYVEAGVPGVWSGGNSGIASSLWDMA